jgi:ribokinase
VRKVVVVGSSNTDMTVRVPRIPAPGETVLGSHFQITAGGKGANQAVAAARAGAQVVFVTALGADALGDTALENVVREGIDAGLVRRVPDAPSGVALIVVHDGSGENAIAVAPGANLALRPADVDPLAGVLEPGDVVLLQLEIPIETVEAAARIAVTRGARVILNPAPARVLPDSLLGAVSMLTPNEAEAEQLAGAAMKGTAGLSGAAAALHARGARDVLITLGARGVFASTGDGSALVAGFAVTAVDTTAAGDVFNGALAAALVGGRSTGDAIRFGCAAAAISVTRPGAQVSAPRRDEIETFLRDR